MADYDLVAVGDGVAGLASIISGAIFGLRCAVIAPACSPSRKPGEIVDANASHLFLRMGLADAIAAAKPVVLPGHTVRKGGESEFIRYAHPAGIKTLVIPREELEALLRTRALSLGVSFFACTSVSIGAMHKRLQTVRVDGEKMNAHFLIDATGSRRLLAKTYGLMVEKHSPPLLAFYWYRLRSEDERPEPLLEREANGWMWTAPAGREETALVRLTWSANRKEVINAIRRDHRWENSAIRAADVSWKIVSKPSGQGYFIVGDAACLLDPGSGNGILRALSSGFLAGELAAAVLQTKIRPLWAEQMFNQHIWRTFLRDKFFLSQLYMPYRSPS